MLLQRINDKENIGYGNCEKSGKMLLRTIEILKKEKEIAIQQNQQRERYHEQQKRKLRIQIEAYKRKVAQLTQSNIIDSLIKSSNQDHIKQSQNSSKTRKLQVQVQHYKNIVNEKDRIIQNTKIQNRQLIKKIRTLAQQKQKHLEISLTQKINLEERVQLLQKQIACKKKIIEELKKEIEKVTILESEINKKERQIAKRGKDMKKYEQQFQSYYEENQKNLQRKIKQLEQQNIFLKKQMKKIGKNLRITCSCQGEAEQWKQKLYEMGKQLAKARVELNKVDMRNSLSIGQKKQKKLMHSHTESDTNQEESMQSLDLSDESSQNETEKSMQKMKC